MNSPSSPKNEDLSGEAAVLRKRLGVDASSPIDAIRLAGDAIPNLTVVHYPFGTGISGMCIKGDGSSVIAINSIMSVGRQNFSMAHELFHLYYDASSATTVCSTVIGSGNSTEKRADQFASLFLIPPPILYELVAPEVEKGRVLTLKSVVSLEQHFLVSRRAILYRLVQDRYLNSAQAEEMKHGVVASALELGYAKTLYVPSPENEQMATTGRYIRQVEELASKNMITDGKYNELKLAGLRKDLNHEEDSIGSEVVD